MSDTGGPSETGSFTDKLRDRAAKLAEKAADKLQNEEITGSISDQAQAATGNLSDKTPGVTGNLSDKAPGVTGSLGDRSSETASGSLAAKASNLPDTTETLPSTVEATSSSESLSGRSESATSGIDRTAPSSSETPSYLSGSDPVSAVPRNPSTAPTAPVPPAAPTTSAAASAPVAPSTPVPPAPPAMAPPTASSHLPSTPEAAPFDPPASTDQLGDRPATLRDANATSGTNVAANPGTVGPSDEINARDVRTTGESWRSPADPIVADPAATPVGAAAWPVDQTGRDSLGEPSGEGRYLSAPPTEPPRRKRGAMWALILLLALIALIAAVLLWFFNRDDDSSGDDGGAGASSTEIEEVIQADLDDQGLTDVVVSVEDGEATLSGTVEEDADIALAEELATENENVDSANTDALTVGDEATAEDDAAAEGDDDDGGDSEATGDDDEEPGDEDQLTGEAAEVSAALADLIEGEPITFDSGSDVLTPEAETTLDDIALILNDSDVDVDVVAYTDNQGVASSNKALSEDRADAVVEYLSDEAGVDEDRMTAIGFGEDNTFDNGDEIERAKNRRIEFTVNN